MSKLSIARANSVPSPS